jgi:hypothetical protein
MCTVYPITDDKHALPAESAAIAIPALESSVRIRVIARPLFDRGWGLRLDISP